MLRHRIGSRLSAAASELWESWPDVAGTALAGDMLSALVKRDAVDVMKSALEVPVVQSVAGPHTLCPCRSRSELWMLPSPGVEGSAGRVQGRRGRVRRKASGFLGCGETAACQRQRAHYLSGQAASSNL